KSVVIVILYCSSPYSCFCHLFLHCSAHHRDLHSFPTRRSSDLVEAAGAPDADRNDRPVKIHIRQPGEAREMPQVQADQRAVDERSEEHTSELQSPYDLVCRLLLEKKKKKKKKKQT